MHPHLSLNFVKNLTVESLTTEEAVPVVPLPIQRNGWLSTRFGEWPQWAHPCGPYTGTFLYVRTIPRSIHICVPNLVTIGPTVWQNKREWVQTDRDATPWLYYDECFYLPKSSSSLYSLIMWSQYRQLLLCQNKTCYECQVANRWMKPLRSKGGGEQPNSSGNAQWHIFFH